MKNNFREENYILIRYIHIYIDSNLYIKNILANFWERNIIYRFFIDKKNFLCFLFIEYIYITFGLFYFLFIDRIDARSYCNVSKCLTGSSFLLLCEPTEDYTSPYFSCIFFFFFFDIFVTVHTLHPTNKIKL